MKNLFKIALSAFAALAIVNCTTDTTEGVGPDYTGKTVKLTVNASLDESRTVIGTPEDGKYPVTWSEKDEVLALGQFVNGEYDAAISAADALKSTTYSLSDDNKNASFSFDVPQVSGTKFDYLACYPASALYQFAPNYNDVGVTIPRVQTPSATSADAAASIMVAHNFNNNTQPESLALEFAHVVGYAKMTVTGLNTNATVSTVTFTAPVNTYITGSYYYYYLAPETSRSQNNATYCFSDVTVNVEELGYSSNDFDVWFAVAPCKLTQFTVTIQAGDDTFVKKVDASSNALSFVAGQVSTFTLDMSEVKVEEPEQESVFELVTSADQITEGTYIFTSDSNGVAYTTPNANAGAGGILAKTLADAGLTLEDTTLKGLTAGYSWEFDGQYLTSTATGSYLYATSTNNGLAVGNTKDIWKFSASTGNTFLVQEQNNSRYISLYISTSPNWRSYLQTNSGISGLPNLKVYKKVEGGTEPEQPAEPKVFRKTTTLEKDKEYIIAMEHNGKTFLLANNGKAGAYDDTSLPAVTVSEVGEAGFTAQGSTLTGDVTNYTFRYDLQSLGAFLHSTKQEGVRLYRQSSNTPILCNTNGTMWKVEASGDAFVIYYYANSFNQYLTVNADEQHAALSTTLSTVTFYEESDGTVEPEEPEEPEEEAVEYSKITTNNLPVGTTATPNSTPVIITVTKGSKTYILYSTPDDSFPASNTYVTAKTLEDAKFTLTDKGISGPITNYTWTTTGDGGSYMFNSSTFDGIALLYLDTDVPLFIKSSPANNLVKRVTDSGDYRLFRAASDNNTYYLSVDDSGELITTTDENEAVINFYGLPEAVEQQEAKENSGPEFKEVSAFEAGKTYIITSSLNGDYALGNDTPFAKVSKEEALTAENYRNFTYKTVNGASSGLIYLQSTANNKYLTNSSNSLILNTLSMGANWRYTNNLLTHAGYGANTSPHLYCTASGWGLTTNASAEGTKITIYEVVE